MHLLEALGIASADEVDPTRPLQLGPLEVGVEAAAEAVRILAGGEFPRDVNIFSCGIGRPFYWAISHKTEGPAEVFGFPPVRINSCPLR